jgi:WD40 repeat protein
MLLLKGHKGPAYALDFSTDGRHLLTGSGDETARLWDLATGTEVASCHTERHCVLHALLVPRSGPLLALVGTPNRLWAWEPDTGRQTLFTPPGGVSALAFAPDGAHLATVGGRGDEGVRLWATGSWQLRASWTAEPEPMNCVAFSPDGKRLATGCEDGTVALWDTGSRKLLGSLGQPAQTQSSAPSAADHFVAHVAFAENGRLLVTATAKTLTVWDTATRQALATHRHRGKHYQGIAVAPGGRLLATANNDAVVRFHGLPGLEERSAFTWKSGAVLSVAFSPDGFRCAAGGRSGKVVVWDVDE